ncbi:MAG: hypothetical protein JSV01_02910 [Desulfobacterales bacterium]|nr:MAG: hypothetical protein JSV01_02910 [Desulfobacterales bacterium]
MVNFLTVAAKHCRQAEHSLSRLVGTAGSFNPKVADFVTIEDGPRLAAGTFNEAEDFLLLQEGSVLHAEAF